MILRLAGAGDAQVVGSMRLGLGPTPVMQMDHSASRGLRVFLVTGRLRMLAEPRHETASASVDPKNPVGGGPQYLDIRTGVGHLKHSLEVVGIVIPETLLHTL